MISDKKSTRLKAVLLSRGAEIKFPPRDKAEITNGEI
jgi:hypothetical protein